MTELFDLASADRTGKLKSTHTLGKFIGLMMYSIECIPTRFLLSCSRRVEPTKGDRHSRHEIPVVMADDMVGYLGSG